MMRVFYAIATALASEAAVGGLRKIIDCIKGDAVARAYGRALAKWSKNGQIRRLYAESRLDTFEKLIGFIADGWDIGEGHVNILCKFVYEELKADQETVPFLTLLETEAANRQLNEIRESQEELLQLSKNILRNTEYIRVVSSGGITEFQPIDGYIYRTCSLMCDEDKEIDLYLHQECYPSFTLCQFVAGSVKENGLKGILFSEAQSGKTIELKHLAYELQEDGLFEPILYEVRDYGNLIDILPRFTVEEQKKVVLLIDALDEKFDGNERNALFHAINGYAKSHPYLRMILSCRSNFKGEISLDGFVRMRLDDITEEQAKEIINNRGTSKLLSYIEKNELYEFTRTPFLLLTLIDFYKKESRVPADKIELYQFVVNKAFDIEGDKKLKCRSYMRRNGFGLLEKIAVGMHLLGVNELNESETFSLVEDDGEWNMVMRSGLLEYNAGKYRFAHNSFKEYFVAGFLSSQSELSDVKKLCCYPGTERIRDTWYNCVALYLSRLKSNKRLSHELLEWISVHNKEMILFIDKRAVDVSLRTELFIGILEEYKAKQMLVGDLSDYKYRRLVDFGFSVGAAQYMLEELRKVDDIDAAAINLLWCLKFIDWDRLYGQDELSKSLFETPYDLLRRFLSFNDKVYYIKLAFENKIYHTKENIARIYDIVKSSNDDYVILRFVSIINKAGFADDYIDYMISKDGLDNGLVHRNGTIRFMSRDELYEAYKSVRSREAMLKVVRHIVLLLKQRYLSDNYERKEMIEVLGSVLSNLAVRYRDDDEVYDTVVASMLDCDKYYSSSRCDDVIDIFVGFFKEVSSAERCFESLYIQLEDIMFGRAKVPERHELDALACCVSRMLDVERVAGICKRLERNTQEGAYLMYNLMPHANVSVRLELDLRLKEFFPDYLFPDYRAEERNRKQAKLDALFARRESVDDASKYDRLILIHGYEYLYPSDTSDIYLSENQRNRIISTALEVLKRMIDGESVDWDMSERALQILLHGDLHIDGKSVLKLLPWAEFSIAAPGGTFNSKDYNVLDYIESRDDITADEIADKIYIDIESHGWHHDFWHRNIVVEFFCRHCLYKGYVLSLNYIKECQEKDYMWHNMLATMVRNEDSCYFVLEHIDELSPVKRLHAWNWSMLPVDASLKCKILKDVEAHLAEYGDNDISMALKLLLRHGSVKGLEYMLEHFEENPLRHDNFTLGSADVAVIPYLVKLYVCAYEENQAFDPFRSSVIGAIEDIAIASDNGFDVAESVLSDLIVSDDKYKFLYSSIERWRIQRLNAKLDIWTMKEVRNFLKKSYENIF